MGATVVVVGFCASGKSTLVDALRARGVEARAVAQEHSIVRDLWNHKRPDLVVFLDVDLDHIRERRNNPEWPDWIYELQRERLSGARARADLVVDTSPITEDQVFSTVIRHLQLD